MSFVVWFTGLSGAGKSTIAELVVPELEARGLVGRVHGMHPIERKPTS